MIENRIEMVKQSIENLDDPNGETNIAMTIDQSKNIIFLY